MEVPADELHSLRVLASSLTGKRPNRRKKKAFRSTRLVGTPSKIQVASAGQRLLPGIIVVLHSMCRNDAKRQLSFYISFC
jgi:hypothetical protein